MTMTAKKTTNEKTLKINYQGKSREIKTWEQLPKDLLSKDFGKNDYIEVRLYRQIARQMGVLKSVVFGKEEIVWRGKNKKGAPIIGMRQICTITTVDDEVFEGVGALSVTETSILSDAIFGTFSRLRARAFKDALKYVDEIFELPDEYAGSYRDIEEVKIDDVTNTVSSNADKENTDLDFKNADLLPAFRESIKWLWKKDLTVSSLTQIAKDIRAKFDIPTSGIKNEMLIEAYKEIKQEYNV